jgi:Fe-S oxidoreductase
MDNQESEKAYSKLYKSVNKEVLAERAKLYRLKTKEIKAEYCRKFRQIIIACPCCNIDIKKYRKVEHDKTIKHLSNLALFEKVNA